MTYSPVLAQKLLEDGMRDNPEIVSLLLIDLHRGNAAASVLERGLLLTAPEILAQLMQVYQSHQTLHYLLGSEVDGDLNQILVKLEPAKPRTSTRFMLWVWDVGKRWLLVSETAPAGHTSLVFLQMRQILQQCVERLID